MSTRRQALEPFRLSDGTMINTGDWICTPAKAMTRDATRFIAPQEFHSFRFIDPKLLQNLELPGSATIGRKNSSQLIDAAD